MPKSPSAYEMALNDFILYADKEHPEIVDVVNQFAVSNALWNVIANAHSSGRYFKKGAKIFLDTKCIFRLIGLEGEYWKQVFQSFVESIKEGGGEIIVFKHVLDEINLIINSARKTYKLENFDVGRASAIACQFHFEHYNDAQIDAILYNLNENSVLSYDFAIEDLEYENDSDEYQIDYEIFKQILTDIYQDSNPDFDADAKDLTIETDIRSITMVYRMRGDNVPRMVRNVDVLFVTTNAGLAQAAKKYDQMYRKNLDGVPV